MPGNPHLRNLRLIISSLLLIMILMLSYYSSIFLSSPGSISGSYGSPSGSNESYYYVFLRNNTDVHALLQSCASIYFIERNLTVPLIPWSLAIDPVCSINNTPFPNEPYITQAFFATNITLPNGTKIFLNIFFDSYIGCGHGKAKIVAVSKDWKDHVLTFHVFVPIDNASSIYVPAVLLSPAAMIVYKYLNTTFFEADIVVSNASFLDSFGLQTIHVKKYSFMFRFLVNEQTWNAYYWNGIKWIPCGYAPIALPIIDVRMLLYRFYENYYDNIHYYMTHPKELKLLVSKLKEMLRNGGTNEAIRYIREMAVNLLPRLWPTYSTKWKYLGKPIVTELDGFVVSPTRFNFTIPGFTDYVPNAYDDEIGPSSIVNLTKRIEPTLYKYIEEYLRTGNLNYLQRLVAKYNGFVYYTTNNIDPSRVDYKWVSLQYLPTVSFWGMMMVLPPTKTAEDLMPRHDIGYLYLEVDVNSSAPILVFKIRGEPSIDRIVAVSGIKCFSGVAIDSRLAIEWMLTGSNVVNYDKTVNMLENLMSVVDNSYVNMWYTIVTGGNWQEAMKNFLSGLKKYTIRAAEALGGSEAAEIMKYTIDENNPYIVPPHIMSAFMTKSSSTVAQITKAPTSRTPSYVPIESMASSITTIAPTRNTTHRSYYEIICVAPIVVVVIAIALYIMVLKGKRFSQNK